ncbi:MAG: zinc-binding dehydrogenase [Proteobacteria bacterium]|nr:zinc-binding dehydrogenase [Pseudomonadota bacterium]
MKALIAKENADPEAPPSARLELADKERPAPGPGEVLVKIEAATCNPSDLHYLKGEYGVPPEWGAAAGFEGAGIVVESGGGFFAGRLKGKRVAVASAGGEGVWAEYLLASAKTCMPINKAVPPEQAATFIVNPFTAFGLLDRAVALGSQAVIVNAAASQVGRLVIRMAKPRAIDVIAIVRREEQRLALVAIGAEHVLLSTDSDFEKQLHAAAHEKKARVAFDCIAGPATAQLLTAMPTHSTVIVYGRLHRDPDDLYGGRYPVGHMIFAGDQIEGFWLSYDIKRLGLWRLLRRSKELQKMFRDGLIKTEIQSRSAIEDFPAAVDTYALNMSAGKAILEF